MGLKAVLDTLDDTPDHFHELYTLDDKTKKYNLTGVEGMVPQSQLAAVKTEAGGYRIELKKAKEQLTAFSALGDITEVQAKLDSIPELEELAKGKIDDKKIDNMVETRLKTKLQPLERELTTWKTKATELEGKVGEYTQKERTRLIQDGVREAAAKLKVTDPGVLEDVLLYGDRTFEVQEDGSVVTKDKVGVTPGLTPLDWLTEMQPKRPHWFGPSTGGGANGNRGGGGGGGTNPWTHDGWNMTEQSRVYNQDPKRAEQLAKAAGTTLGGAKPAPKSK